MKSVIVENVTKIYQLGKIEVNALRGISLKIKKGDFLSVVGPSGSGKTTLLNLIGCLDKPTSGKIYIDDNQDITRLNSKELTKIRRDKISFIFQSFNLIPVLTAYENVEFPMLLKGSNSLDRHKKIISVLEEVGLSNCIHHRPEELSGGQKQRVAIARALVINSSIVLADEPTANLDSKTGQEIIDLMLKINRREGTTFVFSTHDPVIMRYASQVITLHDGIVVN
ncbi:MAG: ABC transporter ATP-binding protein [bacterium]